ncbi:MAG: PQQ-binding-like beta-propeller repeat protein [Solirubrobacterales bacterium]|nr:PQQ-binding-like beta-propeller repeat protein [Solirubrobacterales bacterium]
MSRTQRTAAWGVLGGLLFAIAAGAGCGGGGGGDDQDADVATAREHGSAAEAVSASEPGAYDQFSPEDGDWGTFGGTYDQIRRSPLTEIGASNVGRLGRVFSTDFMELDETIPPQNQSYPVVVDGVIYVTTSFNHMFAIDGATGKEIWHFKPPGIAHFANFGLSPNRGVAYCDGRLYMLTLDMRIVSVSADTGKLVKQVDISDAVEGAKPQLGYFNTAAPICYKGLLFVGTSGSDYGVRGFVMAYRAHDLSPAWANPYWTIPPDGQGWRAEGRFHGGGSVASAVAVDPETDTVYVPVGVPSPVFFPQLRPGPNPKTNSLVALDAFTGEELWWRQQLAEDQWNYDTFASPLVFDAELDGEPRRVVSVATKEGYLFVYDAETGDPIYEQIKLLDRIEHPALRPGEGVTIYPSPLGGVNYTASSYDPDTNYEIVGTAETAAIVEQAESARQLERHRSAGDLDLGITSDAFFGITPKGWHDYGSVRAVDLSSGELAWRVRTPEPERGGATTTASGLTFIGGGDGVLRAIDTATGDVLWKFQTGNQIAAAPSVYEADGREYVAVTVGGTFTSSFGGTGSRLDVFALGGSREPSAPPDLAPAEPAPGSEEPPAWLSSVDQHTLGLQVVARRGEHGVELDGQRGGEMAVTVPQGVRVDVTYTNQTGGSHGLAVTSPGGGGPAFAGASTPGGTRGVRGATPRYFSFLASRPGTYWIACPAQRDAAGERIVLRVGSPGATPTLRSSGLLYSLPMEDSG